MTSEQGNLWYVNSTNIFKHQIFAFVFIKELNYLNSIDMSSLIFFVPVYLPHVIISPRYNFLHYIFPTKL